MKVCEITGKVAIVGNSVSHSHHKTKRTFSPNLRTKRFWSEEEGCRTIPKALVVGTKITNKKGSVVVSKEVVVFKKTHQKSSCNGKERQKSLGDF